MWHFEYCIVLDILKLPYLKHHVWKWIGNDDDDTSVLTEDVMALSEGGMTRHTVEPGKNWMSEIIAGMEVIMIKATPHQEAKYKAHSHIKQCWCLHQQLWDTHINGSVYSAFRLILWM